MRHIFQTLYSGIAAIAVATGLIALASEPLRSPWITGSLFLLSLAVVLAQMGPTLLVWGVRAFLSMRNGGIRRAMRKRWRVVSRVHRLTAGSALAAAIAFLVLEVISEAQSPKVVSSWGGLAFALRGCFVGLRMLPVSVARSRE